MRIDNIQIDIYMLFLQKSFMILEEMIKHHDQTQLGRKGFISSYSCSLLCREVSTETGVETMEERCSLAYFPILVSYTSKERLPSSRPPTVVWAFTHQSSKKYSKFTEVFSQLMTLACVKLSKN